MNILLKDHGGEASWIVSLGVWAAAIVSLKFFVNGIDLPIFGLQPEMSVMDFAYAFGIATAHITVRKVAGVIAEATNNTAKAKVEAAVKLVEAATAAEAVLAKAKVIQDTVLADARVKREGGVA